MTDPNAAPPPDPRWTGFLVIDKPLGISSMAVVSKVRWAASRGAGVKKSKCGHAGTLDPLATGVVICCCGKATKQIDRFMGLTKEYVAEVDLTAFTTTEDREGERTEVEPARGVPTREHVAAACASFVGEAVEQVPPRFSAIHVDGQRAYALARAGEDVKMKPRFVRIDAVELLDYAWPLATIACDLRKGHLHPKPRPRPGGGAGHRRPPGQSAADGHRPVSRGRRFCAGAFRGSDGCGGSAAGARVALKLEQKKLQESAERRVVRFCADARKTKTGCTQRTDQERAD